MHKLQTTLVSVSLGADCTSVFHHSQGDRIQIIWYYVYGVFFWKKCTTAMSKMKSVFNNILKVNNGEHLFVYLKLYQ